MFTLVLVFVPIAYLSSLRHVLEWEFVENQQEISERSFELPKCQKNSTCALIQKNAKGTYAAQSCECGGGNKCPLTWDSQDGHSITQGSDQYKFCEEAPRDLSPCDSTQTAVVMFIGMTNKNKIVEFSNVIYCFCPEHHVYENPEIKTEIKSSIKYKSMHFKCQKLDTCEEDQICGVGNLFQKNFVFEELCVCPDNLICPSNPDVARPTDHEGGRIEYKFLCPKN
uniref:SLPTX11 n=1 Tax=Hemiscolopendra marginata TaxID=943146 RepID=A0A646QE15_9MYRI